MKKTLFLSITTSIIAFILASCNSTSNITSSSEQLIHTDGIYIAINKNVSAFRKIGDSSLPVNSIKVIRFTSQGEGIIIPESLTNSELLDTARIRVIYNWCLNYETKNPKDKEFIHVKPRFENDTIKFFQKSSDTEIIYQGINYKDSINLVYQTIYQGQNNPNMKQKELSFKFYKLN